MNPFDESTLCQTSATLVFANMKLRLKKKQQSKGNLQMFMLTLYEMNYFDFYGT